MLRSLLAFILFLLLINGATAYAAPDILSSTRAIQSLQETLKASSQTAFSEQSFSKTALSKADAAKAAKMLWAAHLARDRKERERALNDKSFTIGEHTLRFDYHVYGAKPEGGRSLFISMHGGGGAPHRINDSQWENQKRLYKPEEGVYVAPRAPTDTWNLWHQGHIDALFDRLIEIMISGLDVNSNRVYLMGYSAGGDGVYQLGPRMADRWAAVAMMAGHPNEASPLSLRNLGFTLHMGANDAAYKRNEIATEWKTKLAQLRDNDPNGYPHEVVIHKGMGHWMDKKDAIAVPWMAKFIRNPFPDTIVWEQDDVLQTRFYWLEVERDKARKRTVVHAQCKDQTIDIKSKDVLSMEVLLNDQMMDLDRKVSVKLNGEIVFSGPVKRTIANLATSLIGRSDPSIMCSVRIAVP